MTQVVVAVFGATGNIGQALLPRLVDEPNIQQVRVLTQRPQCVLAPKDRAKLQITTGDYTQDEAVVTKVLTGCDRALVC